MSKTMFAVLFLWSVPAHAAELPCPSKHYFCWQVKLAVSTFGEPAVRAKAKQCGWTDKKIADAEKCLR